jgi:hypothetical protein
MANLKNKTSTKVIRKSKAQREEILANALRINLRKRKAQLRARRIFQGQ